jgi:two-component sensor histidine kinase
VAKSEPVAEKAVLLSEIHHRVKNNLAVVSCLLSMKANGTHLPEAKLAIDAVLCRVRAMALVHERLYADDHFDQINFSECVTDLAQEVSVAFNPSGSITMKLDVCPIRLDLARAVPCALILNELLTNAFQHVFPADQDGTIVVRFRQTNSGEVELIVRDNGMDASSGLELVDLLSRQLDGSVERVPGPGTCIVVRFPVE